MQGIKSHSEHEEPCRTILWWENKEGYWDCNQIKTCVVDDLKWWKCESGFQIWLLKSAFTAAVQRADQGLRIAESGSWWRVAKLVETALPSQQGRWPMQVKIWVKAQVQWQREPGLLNENREQDGPWKHLAAPSADLLPHPVERMMVSDSLCWPFIEKLMCQQNLQHFTFVS